MVRLCLIFIVAIFSVTNLYSQTLLQQMKNDIHNMILKDSKTWKASEYVYGTVEINNASEDIGFIVLKGTFTANITQWPFKGKRTIYFNAEVKQILDDFAVNKVLWSQPIANILWCIGDCD